MKFSALALDLNGVVQVHSMELDGPHEDIAASQCYTYWATHYFDERENILLGLDAEYKEELDQELSSFTTPQLLIVIGDKKTCPYAEHYLAEKYPEAIIEVRVGHFSPRQIYKMLYQRFDELLLNADDERKQHWKSVQNKKSKPPKTKIK